MSERPAFEAASNQQSGDTSLEEHNLRPLRELNQPLEMDQVVVFDTELSRRLPLLGFVDVDDECGAFVKKLLKNRGQLRRQIDDFVRKSGKTEMELALAIYLKVTLEAHVFGVNPFAEGNAELREEISFLATEIVARNWFSTILSRKLHARWRNKVFMRIVGHTIGC
jgi:hypothetical protein